jgi:eukaryotic-like serine/threonine-protein kinase
MIGTRLAHYEITSHIGSGGMGDVYQATDTKLGRSVAIKFLPEAFSHDTERVARFQREARVLASLNHTNIAVIHGVEEIDSRHFLVMELVPGETLADRIKRGAIPIEEALPIAKQIAEALEEAHEKGIIHRDLKPANIKMTPEGKVKVLDFGLAKAFEGETPNPDLSNSPTLSMAATNAGVILGTAAYMSPEQAKGRTVDKRTDIWAFGVVFYELLTGEPLFKGEDVSEVMAAVIKEELHWERVPAQIRRLLQRCLERDPRKRLRDIGDVWELLDKSPEAPIAVAHGKTRWLWPSVAALSTIVAAVALWALWSAPLPDQRPMRFEVDAPDKNTFAAEVSDPPAVSPDGKRIAFLAMGQDGRTRIWIRDLDSLDSRRLDGTEEAAYAFWSPDGKWLAFQHGAELKKIAIAGGPPQTICACQPTLKGAWSKQGVIVFSAFDGIMKVSENGGPVVALTSHNPSRDETVHVLPSLLPDHQHFLYLQASRRVPDYKFGLYVGSIDARPEEQPQNRVFDVSAQYESGRLLFVRAGALMAQDFDINRFSVTGEAMQLVKVEQILAPLPGGHVLASGGVGSLTQLTWFDRHGKPLGTIGEPGVIFGPRVSSDNASVVFTRYDTGPASVWLYEPKRGAYQFAFKPAENSIFSPDGSRIAFGADKLYQKAASGIGDEEPLLATAGRPAVLDWSRDGKYLFFGVSDVKTKTDIWVLPLSGDKKASPYFSENFNENLARLSPDGRWLAWESDALNDQYEVYVGTFAGSASGTATTSQGRWKISTAGGSRPVWSRDGKELFFISADRKMMAVDVTGSGATEFKFTAPKPLFDAPINGNPWRDQFDVSPDGRFLMPIPVQRGVTAPITVIVNWTEALKK